MEGGFYIGIHKLGLAKHFPTVCISTSRLWSRVSGFKCSRWIMDSGAFTQLSRFGEYRDSVLSYYRLIRRWSCSQTLVAAVTQDYMCESFILAKTGLSVADHQRLTIERYDSLLALNPPVPIIPVLQGYHPTDYVRHLVQYGDRITEGMWVGVGSVCKRNTSPHIVRRILSSIRAKRDDLRLHGFGVKITALEDPCVVRHLYSADSMGWSYSARKQGRDPNALEEATRFYNRIQATILGAKP